jgi:hypothetical protein
LKRSKAEQNGSKAIYTNVREANNGARECSKVLNEKETEAVKTQYIIRQLVTSHSILCCFRHRTKVDNKY